MTVRVSSSEVCLSLIGLAKSIDGFANLTGPESGSSFDDFSLSWVCLSEWSPPVLPFNDEVVNNLDYHHHADDTDYDDRTISLGNDKKKGNGKIWERHVFLCFKDPLLWASGFIASDRLPRVLSAAIKLRKDDMPMKTRLFICEGRDGTESSNGDIMIFPDMIRYRGLTHFDVDVFVEEVLVHNKEWLPGQPERLSGTHSFVCTHGNHLWPTIIQKMQEHIAAECFASSLCVKPCFSIEDYNKYAMNLIAYGLNTNGEVLGHCYGFVTPQNACNVLKDLHRKGYQLAKGDRHSEAVKAPLEQEAKKTQLGSRNVRSDRGNDANGQLQVPRKASVNCHISREEDRSKRRSYTSSRWLFDYWEKEDTLAALVVVSAMAFVSLATHLYRTHW